MNSFGFGGSNVHVVLDDVFNFLNLHGLDVNGCLCPSAADVPEAIRAPALASPLVEKESENLFVWSAPDEDGLKRSIKLYATHLSSLQSLHEPQKYLKNLAYTLSAKRSLLRWRSCVVASSFQGLLQILEKGMPETVRSNNTFKVGFVFTGQGAQWHAMGRELLELPLYRESLATSQRILNGFGCVWSLFGKHTQYTSLKAVPTHIR